MTIRKVRKDHANQNVIPEPQSSTTEMDTTTVLDP